MDKKTKEYETTYAAPVNVYIKYEKDSLRVWEDDKICYGIIYEKYEERLRKGEDFTKVCEDLVLELRESR